MCQVFVGTFLVFRNSAEKLCVSWALPFVECVAVWALKLPVVSAPLRSLHNRSPLDFLQLIPTYSKPTRYKVFLRNYWNPNKPTKNSCPSISALVRGCFHTFSLSPLLSQPAPLHLTSPLFPKKQKIKRNPPKSYICNANIPLFGGFFLFFS